MTPVTERIITFLLGVALLVWLFFLVSCTHHTVIVPLDPLEFDKEDHSDHSVCTAIRGEDQSFEQLWTHFGYNSMERACI